MSGALASVQLVVQGTVVAVFPSNNATSALLGRNVFAPGAVPDVRGFASQATGALQPNISLTCERAHGAAPAHLRCDNVRARK